MTDEGFAVDPSMVERNLIWVLTRLQIQMVQYPCWGDLVEVETWLSPQGRAAANREYVLRNVKTGDVLGNVTSIWVCVNTKTKRLVRIPDDIRQKSERFTAPDRPSPIPKAEARQKIQEIDTEHATRGVSRFAGHMNLDMNNHINNVAYLSWALDLLPDEIFETYILRQVNKSADLSFLSDVFQVEIDFKAECQAGDLVEGRLMEVSESMFNYEKQFVHSLRISEEDKSKELVRLRTSWSQ